MTLREEEILFREIFPTSAWVTDSVAMLLHLSY